MIALLYGVAPHWFALKFLCVPELDIDLALISRAVICLYLALGLCRLFAAYSDKFRNTAVLTAGIFSAALMRGRIISFFVGGQSSPLLAHYISLVFVLVPVAYWVFKLPE